MTPNCSFGSSRLISSMIWLAVTSRPYPEGWLQSTQRAGRDWSFGGSAARGQRAEGRAQRAEGREQRAEGRGQRAEVRGQRSEVRGQNKRLLELIVSAVRANPEPNEPFCPLFR